MIWFERDDILELLRKRISGFQEGYRQNVALLGPEAMGKSILLKRLMQEVLSSSAPLVPFPLEMVEDESMAEWAERFVQTLLYGFLQAKGVASLPSGRSELVAVCSEDIPKTCIAATRLLEEAPTASRSADLFDDLWDLTHRLTQESGLGILVLLDEFDKLESLPIKDPFQRLGRKIMVQSGTLFLMTSSNPEAARKVLRDGLALLFGQFEVVSIGPLSPAATLQGIRSVWPSGKGDSFFERLLMELVQGHPGNLDLLQQGLMLRTLTDASFNAEYLVLDLLESLLFEPQGSLRLLFEERLKTLPTHRNRLLWLQVLGSVAQGKHRISEIALELDRPTAQVTRALRFLEQSHLVNHQGIFYKIPDHLFELWMRTTYPVLQGLERVDPSQGRIRFRELMEHWISEVRGAISQPMSERVAVLMNRWRSEIVEVEGHRILLPQWKQVEPFTEIPGLHSLLAQRAGKSEKGWLMIPWSGPITETHARELLERLGSLRSVKGMRKVLVGAFPVEIHARLILQQARVRMWDLQVLNDLLDLYGLVRVPVATTTADLLVDQVPAPSEDPPSVQSGSATEVSSGQ